MNNACKVLLVGLIMGILLVNSMNSVSASKHRSGDWAIGYLQTKLREIAKKPVAERVQLIGAMVYPRACKAVHNHYRQLARKLPQNPSLRHCFPGGQPWWNQRPHLIFDVFGKNQWIINVKFNENTLYFEIPFTFEQLHHWEKRHEDEEGMQRWPRSWYEDDGC